MSDKPKIIAGLAVFLVLATFPIWYTLGSIAYFSTDPSAPELDVPAGALKFTAPWPDGDVGLKGLQAAFERHQIPPLSDPELIPDEQGDAWKTQTWRIEDGQRRYLVLKDKDRPGTLSVYDGCVKDRETMLAEHMSLLIDWREGVVRQGDRSCVEINGEEYAKSLTGTCLKCHTDTQKFCYRCHVYANALPAWPSRSSAADRPGIRCWNCHVEPEKK